MKNKILVVDDEKSIRILLREELQDEGYEVRVGFHFIEYKLPARPEGDLEVSTWLSHIEPESALRHYTIKRVSDGKLLTRVRALEVWLNQETGKRVSIPPAFLEDLKENTVP